MEIAEQEPERDSAASSLCGGRETGDLESENTETAPSYQILQIVCQGSG